MKGTLSLEQTVKEELTSVRQLRQEILEKAEDIAALETVIETEGFQIDHFEKEKFADLRALEHARKLSAMGLQATNQEEGTTDGDDRDEAQIYISNLNKDNSSLEDKHDSLAPAYKQQEI